MCSIKPLLALFFTSSTFPTLFYIRKLAHSTVLLSMHFFTMVYFVLFFRFSSTAQLAIDTIVFKRPQVFFLDEFLRARDTDKCFFFLTLPFNHISSSKRKKNLSDDYTCDKTRYFIVVLGIFSLFAEGKKKLLE